MNKKEAMDCFLKRYNSERTKEKALSRAISAAVQHNKLYKTIDHVRKKEIRRFWAFQLEILAERIGKVCVNDEQYLNEIQELKIAMNSKFNDDLEFRISHSQKSISVFFKHLWCMGQINTPPQCPVDRIILTKVDAPIKDRSWGYVDTIEEHKRKYELIRKFAFSEGFDNESDWELISF